MLYVIWEILNFLLHLVLKKNPQTRIFCCSDILVYQVLISVEKFRVAVTLHFYGKLKLDFYNFILRDSPQMQNSLKITSQTHLDIYAYVVFRNHCMIFFSVYLSRFKSGVHINLIPAWNYRGIFTISAHYSEVKLKKAVSY